MRFYALRLQPSHTARFYARWIFDSTASSSMSNARNQHHCIGRGCVSFIVGSSWEGQLVSRRGTTEWPTHWWFEREFLRFIFLICCGHCGSVRKKGYYFRTYLKIVAEITFRVNLTEMLALSSLYAVCVWMSLACPSLGTGFVYHFPSITVQRQRIKSEQSGSGGPPGTGPRTQLRWAHVQSSDSLMSVSSKLISDTGSTKKS